MTMKSGLEKIVSSDKDLPVRKPQKILIRPSYFSVLSCHIFFKGFTKWRRLRRFIPFSKFVLFVMLFFIFSEVLRNEDGNIGGPCQGEMKAHRLMLMEDHAISPELVAKCGTDITASCKGLRDQIYEIFFSKIGGFSIWDTWRLGFSWYQVQQKSALLTCMCYSYCDELGAFKPSFYHHYWYFEAKN